MKQIWQSTDGKKVGTLLEITAYERETLSKAERDFEKFKGTYWYKQVNKHSLNTHGIWHVQGEDPNCDLGGHHYRPTLGYFEGTLEDVIRKAVTLPGFWQWGAGGEFTLVNTVKV